jgi:hypothetical protein
MTKGKKKSGGDYEGWILRLIDKPEDIVFSYSLIDWLKFAAEKIGGTSGQGITKGQIGALSEYRNLAFELPQDIGISVREVTRYRDAKGRWSKEPTDRLVKAIVIRGEGEKFMSRSKSTDLLRAELEARGIRKSSKWSK